MKTNPKLEKLITQISDAINDASCAHEMDSAISVEFTPPPDYSCAASLMLDREAEIMSYLEKKAEQEFVDLAEELFDEECFPGVKYKDMDVSYTPSGGLMQHLDSIVHEI